MASRDTQMGLRPYHYHLLPAMVALFLINVVAPSSAQQREQSISNINANKEAARVHVRRALEFDRTGRYQEAVAAYKRALELAPSDAGIYNNLGNALANLGRFNEAIAAFERAIEFSPPDFISLAYINLGLVYAQTDPTKGNEVLRKVISLNPEFPKARLGLCDLRLALHQNDEAVACYEAVLPLILENPKAQTYLGIALSRVGRYKDAMNSLVQTTRHFPTYAEAYNQLGQVLIQSGCFKESIEYLTRAIELDPKNEYAHYNLGIAELADKHRVSALKQYDFLKHSHPDLAQKLYEMIYGGRLLSIAR